MPLALHHIINPRTNVITLVVPLECSLAMLFTVSELSLVCVSVGPLINASSELHAICPIACVLCPISMKVNSLAMLLVIGELTLVYIAIRIVKLSISFCLTLYPSAFIPCSICPFLNAIAMLHVIFQLSLVLSISFQLYLLYFVILNSFICLFLELLFLSQILLYQLLHFLGLIVLVLMFIRKYFPSIRLKPSRRTHFSHFTILISHNNIHFQLFRKTTSKTCILLQAKLKSYYYEINMYFYPKHRQKKGMLLVRFFKTELSGKDQLMINQIYEINYFLYFQLFEAGLKTEKHACT